MPSETERPARFRFPVTWSSLLDSSELPPGEKSRVVVNTEQARSDSTVQWAMVIPKLATASVPRLPPVAEAQWNARFDAPKYVIPKFEVSVDSSSLAVKFLLSAAVAMLLVPGWRNTGSPGARAIEMESAMGQSGWVRESAGPTRQLVLSRASAGRTDYRLDFTWIANPQGVTCVFRAKDSNNYYLVRIKSLGPESSRAVSMERAAVIRGVEKSHVQRLLTPGKGTSLRASIDVAGNVFRLYLEGTLVSQWTDSRLSAGGLGFVEEAGRPLGVQSVKISYPPQLHSVTQ